MKNMTEGDLSLSTLCEEPSNILKHILNQDVEGAQIHNSTSLVCLNIFLRTPTYPTGLRDDVLWTTPPVWQVV
jgi:hypothetical protein